MYIFFLRTLTYKQFQREADLFAVLLIIRTPSLKLYSKFCFFLTIDFILDGDLVALANAQEAYMKQKHRLLWERRHGPIGSGMKQPSNEPYTSDDLLQGYDSGDQVQDTCT